jgi:enoyl-[acyl-carrier protein] reductase I
MAAQRVFPDYNDMADKSLLRVSCRSLDFEEKKVRVNTISQSPTATKAVKLLKALSFCIC